MRLWGGGGTEHNDQNYSWLFTLPQELLPIFIKIQNTYSNLHKILNNFIIVNVIND